MAKRATLGEMNSVYQLADLADLTEALDYELAAKKAASKKLKG